MAFLRFTRDKRGYEHFYLVQPTTNRRGKVRTRILYWFRTPPNVKVGRQPFDEALRRALEAQNPGVDFDWQKIVDTPIPSADAEKWRERRRAERAERMARQAGTDVEETAGESATVEDEPPSDDQTTEAPRTDVSEVRASQPDEQQQQQQQQQRQQQQHGGGGADADAAAVRSRQPNPSRPKLPRRSTRRPRPTFLNRTNRSDPFSRGRWRDCGRAAHLAGRTMGWTAHARRDCGRPAVGPGRTRSCSCCSMRSPSLRWCRPRC